MTAQPGAPFTENTTAPSLLWQVSAPLLGLRAAGDGAHQLTISLHPEELGPVNLRVRILDGAMTIQLASGNDLTRESIQAALPQLHAELRSAGLSPASVSVDPNSGGSGSDGSGSGGWGSGASGSTGGFEQRRHPESAGSAPSPSPAPLTGPTAGPAERPANAMHAPSALDRWL